MLNFKIKNLKYRISLYLISSAFTFGVVFFTPQAVVFAQDVLTEKPFQKVPDEFLLAEVPGLENFGPFFISWGVLRPPQLWLQGQVFNLNDFKFPQWNKDQFPFSLIPSMGYRASIQFFDTEKKPLEKILLDQPFPLIDPKLEYLKEQVKSLNTSEKKISYFQIQLESPTPRVLLHSALMNWPTPQEIFSCEFEITKEEDLRKNKRFNTCLKTLAALPENAQNQWYAWVQLPKGLSKENAQYLSEKIREVSVSFKKSKNFFMSLRGKNRFFSAKAGVTHLEKLETPQFNFSQIQNAEYAVIPPSREKQEQVAHSQSFENGEKIEIYSFASDASEDREKNLGQIPDIHLQFVPTSTHPVSNQPLTLKKTAFKESRTGLSGLLRPWRLGLFASYNSLTSNRGEKDQIFNFLGADLSYKLNYFGFDPHLIFESGLWHPGSTISISEIDLGASKSFFEDLPWLRASAGYHNYTLSGRNPGSSRLGRMDSISLGLLAQTMTEDRILRGRFQILAASPMGFDSRIESGKIYHNFSDTPQYLGYFLGYSRYAGNIQNRNTLVSEAFTEERISLGVIWGHIGPESF
ncbi:MAG TPA: hypothetical protein PLJ21_09030 [Pseudobdellovibrionaceae bacterium]|nr:hypothetical protein [Pseudobdellovibrionaceae bacterium]